MKSILLIIILFTCFLHMSYAQHPGDLDKAFGKQGIVTADFGNTVNHYGRANQVLAPDSSIYIILSTDGGTIVTKKQPGGSPDSTFGHNGFSEKLNILEAHAVVQPDAKLVIAGKQLKYHGNTDLPDFDFIVARLNTNGSLDVAFGNSGYSSSNLAGDDGANSVAITSNGQLVLAGFSVTYPYEDNNGFISIATFDASGSATSEFLTEFPANTEVLVSLAAQPDGKFVIAATSNTGLILARYNIDGSKDNNFIVQGNQQINAHFSARSLAIQNDGKIVVGGFWQNSSKDFALLRYNATGSLDNTFSSDGIQTTDFKTYDDILTSIVIQTDNKVVAAGYASNGINYGFAIARYNVNGSLDNSFDVDGIRMTYIGTGDNYGNSLALRPGGKFIIAGYNGNENSPIVKVAAYKANGSLDSSFQKKGIISDSLKQRQTVYTSSAVQPDGKIISAGYTWNGANYDVAVARYLIDGRLDNTFSGDGVQLSNQGADEFARAVAIQPDSKIIVAGTGLIRYNADGSLDNTFNGTGKQSSDFEILFVKLQADGKIIAAGSQTIARYNTNGSVDLTFNGIGRISNTTVKDIALQSDGKIVVIDYKFYVTRYNTNGTLNGSTNDGTFENINFFPGDPGDDYQVQQSTSLAIQKDGKILIGGYAGFQGRYDEDDNVALARYNTNGSLDTSFSGTGKTIIQFDQLTIDGTIAIESDNKIVVKGVLYYNADRYYYREITPLGYAFARLNTNGSLDLSFGAGGKTYPKINAQVNGTVIGNNKLYITGYGKHISEFGYLSRYLLAENKAPAVKIASPADNATFNAPANFTLAATASVPGDTLRYVQFYSNGALLQTDSTSPYSYAMVNAPAGTYSFVAKATAFNGLTSNSASIAVAVSASTNKAPAISLTAPANNATFTAGSMITIKASASDPDGAITSVKFYNGASLLNTDNSSPYSYTYNNAVAGSYKFYAIATDDKGLKSSSATASVVVGSAQSGKTPAVSISSPLNNASYTSPAAITLNASASDPDGSITSVQFFNGSTLLKTDSTSPYSYTVTNAAAGNYSFTAKAIDNSGLTNNSSSVAVVVAVPENKSPAVTITSPANSALYYAPATIILNASASDPDGTINNVKFYSGATLLKTVTTSPFTDTLKNLTAGSYSFTAKATDNKGASATAASVYVSVLPNQPPEIYLNPSYSAYTVPPTISWTAGASDADGSISYVEFYNGTTLLNRDSTYPYEYKWINVPAGSYTLTGKATDNHGATGFETVNLDFYPVSDLEAEDAYYNGPVFSTAVPGFTGYGYTDFVNASNDFVQWTVDASAAGQYLLQFRYGNGSSGNRPLRLEVNGVTINASLDFSPTGSWSSWSVSSFAAPLIEGDNVIRLIAIGSNGPNLDNLSVATNSLTLEAEDAVLNGAVVASAMPGYIGTGYADYVNASNDYVEWTANMSKAGSYSLLFRYANGVAANRPLKLEVNGALVKAKLDFTATGGWSTWSTSAAAANLIAGANKIRLTATGSNGANLDNLVINSSSSLQPAQSMASVRRSISERGAGNLTVVASPNPASDKVRLSLTSSSSLPVSFTLVDMAGRICRAARLVSKAPGFYDFSVRNLPAGPYIIVLNQGNLIRHVRLIVSK